MGQTQYFTIDGESYNFDDLVRKADSGNIDAMAAVGDMLVLGKYGIRKDEPRGWQYYQKAAAAGNPGALFQVGLAYFDGGYYKTNEKLGTKYLQKSADAGYINAQYIYGCMLKNKKKVNKSAHYFELAARQGHSKAYYELGLYYLYDAHDIDEAIRFLCFSSLKGEADADKMLNEMVQRGVPRASERIQNQFDILRSKQTLQKAPPRRYIDTFESPNKKLHSVLSYIQILWLIGILSSSSKDDRQVRHHVGQGIILTIFNIVGSIILTIITGILFTYSTPSTAASVINSLLNLANTVFSIVCIIIGIVNASKGNEKCLPIIGKISILKKESPRQGLMDAAQQGDSLAQYLLGLYYFSKGNNYDHGVYWLCVSESCGNRDATNLLQKKIETNMPRIHERIANARARLPLFFE